MRAWRIVANLDAEIELAALALGRRRASLPRPALSAISGAGTLLRAFARDGDRLWTPGPVDPARVPDVAGLPRVVLESGSREKLEPVEEEWPWMETPTAPRMPKRIGKEEGGHGGPPLRVDPLCSGEGGATHTSPFRGFPSSEPGVVVRVADRGWGLAVAARLGRALPGAAAVSTGAGLAAAVAELGQPWVLKAAFSAAGRDRLRGENVRMDEAAAERFFARHGWGVVEPWLDREADFGAAGEVDAEGNVARRGLHRLRVDAGGRFQGIELIVGQPETAPGLEAAEAATLAAALGEAGAALAAEGYRGPYGLDALRFRTPGGGLTFHPWVELNPRMTFGRVARELVDRMAGAMGWVVGERIRLRFGRAMPSGATILLRPGVDGSAGACLERSS